MIKNLKYLTKLSYQILSKIWLVIDDYSCLDYLKWIQCNQIIIRNVKIDFTNGDFIDSFLINHNNSNNQILKLDISYNFTNIIHSDQLNQELQELYVGAGPRFIIGNSLPKNLKILHLFDYNSNSSDLDLVIDNNLIEFKVEMEYLYKINNKSFSNQMEILKFGNDFNQVISSLPNNIKCLDLGSFDHPITFQWPNNLKVLKMNHYSWSMNHLFLPNTIVELDISGSIESFENLWPSSLTKLTFANINLFLKPNSLPPSCKILNFTNYNLWSEMVEFDIIPNSVVELNLGYYFDLKLECLNLKMKKNLKILDLGHCFNLEFNSVESLPNGLEILNLGRRFNQKLLNLPSSCLKLEMNFIYEYQHIIGKNVLNIGLQELKLQYPSKFPLEKDILPNTLKKIEFDDRFNSFLKPNSIPCNVEHIKFNCKNYKHILSKNIFPSGLKSLILSTFTINNIKIPRNVRNLVLNYKDQEIPINFIPRSVTSLYFNGLKSCNLNGLENLKYCSFNQLLLNCDDDDKMEFFKNVPKSCKKIYFNNDLDLNFDLLPNHLVLIKDNVYN
ncbi:hypothetical protein CYY_004641 [Polysphondylium violaceum]|uniref:FNIP repeat-containing protein n=1 Tax=Polysphondylium violaceum TaxID=133409 RepID=A0A8J4V4Y1_9MYCE|nr:hypothetical protein CYY_004641 [Polysphondylium violaceum]